MKDARYAQDNNQHLAGFFQPDEKTEYQRLCIEYSLFPVFVGDSDADGSLRGDSLYPGDGAESDHCADRCDAGYCGCHVESLVVDVYKSSVGILPVALIAMVWSAAKGVMALMRGLNAVNGVDEKRNYFVIRFIASFYTLIMLVVLILSLFFMVFGNQLVDIALHRIPQLQMFVSLLMNFRFLFVWAVLILLFGLIYTYIPDTKLKFTEQVPGACFAAVVWSVFSWGFSMYVSYGNGYSIYGSLTIIVIIMLWMYFCMYIILIGAYLNRYFRPMNRVLVNHASSKSELARENRRRIREIKKIQRRKKHYTEIDRDPKEKDENLTDRN